MSRKNLIIILLIDFIIVVGTVYLIRVRYLDYKSRLQLGPSTKKQLQENKTTISPKAEPILPAETPKKEIRNIRFQYRSSKANAVSIIGDFNDWTPEPLTKTKKNVWQIVMKMESGRYKYNYVVNGKVILDPNNTKTPVETSRGFKSSLLIIKPLSKKK